MLNQVLPNVTKESVQHFKQLAIVTRPNQHPEMFFGSVGEIEAKRLEVMRQDGANIAIFIRSS